MSADSANCLLIYRRHLIFFTHTPHNATDLPHFRWNFCIILERMEWSGEPCDVFVLSCAPFSHLLTRSMFGAVEGQCVHIHKWPADVELSQRHSISVTAKLGNFSAEFSSSKWNLELFTGICPICRFYVAGVVHKVLNAKKFARRRVEINNYIVCQVTVWKCAEYAINSITC